MNPILIRVKTGDYFLADVKTWCHKHSNDFLDIGTSETNRMMECLLFLAYGYDIYLASFRSNNLLNQARSEDKF